MNREPDRNPRKALGKGLSALLPSRPTGGAESHRTAPPETVPAKKPEIPAEFDDFRNIPLDQITPGEEQPRTMQDTQKLMELAQSIRAHGVLQPITVRKVGPEKYKIIAGERRWHAAQLAELSEIPALIRSGDELKRLELALIENIQREDLNPMEIATAFGHLAEEHGLSHDQIAERTGKDRSTVTNFVRLLRLSPYVQDQMLMGRISMGQGRALLNITDEEQQIRTCDQIIAQQLSVRQTEQLVKSLTNEGRGAKAKREEQPLDPNVRAALEEMAAALGTKVKLHPRSPDSGRLEIEYYSQDDLDRIYSVIVKQ